MRPISRKPRSKHGSRPGIRRPNDRGSRNRNGYRDEHKGSRGATCWTICARAFEATTHDSIAASRARWSGLGPADFRGRSGLNAAERLIIPVGAGESAMRREEHRLLSRSLTVGFILVTTGVVLAGTIPPVLSAQPAPAPKGDDHDADRAAILAVMKSLPQAFEKADVKAIAATWTSQGEYTAADGTTLHGREALEKAYGEFFKKNPKVTLDYESESLRFVAPSTAVGEGYATLHRVPSEPPTVS